jgi:hypothetical protein
VTRTVVAGIVDRPLALSGDAGYLNASPLARAYRDVMAGSFMHPLGANRADCHLAEVVAESNTEEKGPCSSPRP